jgi:catechol 2,3-dioxygenase
VGSVHLRVSDLEQALAFYQGLLGFRLVGHGEGRATLTASGKPPHPIQLSEQPGARRKPSRTTGLYHVAIRFPDRPALARVFQRLLDHRWPFQGFSDHGVSEAVYLADADGNGIELYTDRPRERWARKAGQIAMTTLPLDVEGLLAEANDDAAPWTGVAPETDIGHVHLQISNLAQSEQFYSGLLGLEVTQRSYPGALFLSAGGYHHHLGLNTWAGEGAPPPPPEAVGLVSFGLELPDETTWQSAVARLRNAGKDVETRKESSGGSALAHDPDGTGVELVYATQPSRGGR